MIVNANLMLMVVLLRAGTLPVVSPERYPYMAQKFWGKLDCDKYNLPINTMWIQRDSCEDNKRFKCKRGYVSQVQTTCKNEVWILEPACQECPQGVNITNSDDVTESRIFGEDFSFNCSVGYTKNGETGTLRCGENGMWLEQQACQGNSLRIYSCK
ncbi:hypothetical protein LOTGIDRAFT_175535, partial [Lottia gigantea]